MKISYAIRCSFKRKAMQMLTYMWEWFLNIKMMWIIFHGLHIHQISTQFNNQGRFWSDLSNNKDINNTKEHGIYSGDSWWNNSFIRHSIGFYFNLSPIFTFKQHDTKLCSDKIPYIIIKNLIFQSNICYKSLLVN